MQSKLQGSTGATVRALAQQKLGVTLPPASGQLVILRSNQLKTAQDIANAVKGLAIVLPALGILLFALAVYLARGRRRRTLRTTGWCFVLIGAALLLIRRVAGDAVVNGLVKVPSNQPAAHQVWNIGTSLLRDIAVAMIVYGIVIIASAWLAGPTRPATEIRKALAPTLRDSPAVAYCTVGGLLLLLVLIGPTPAFRNIVWILLFAVLLAYGVTMLRRQTALEFAGIQHGQALRDLRDQRAKHHARKTAPTAQPQTPDDPCSPATRARVCPRQRACRDAGATRGAESQRRDHRRRVRSREDTRHEQRQLTERRRQRWRPQVHVDGRPLRDAGGPPREAVGGRAAVPHLSVAERVARGKAARSEVPRADHAKFEPPASRADPVELLERQAKTRVPELVPIRYGRMLVSPFTFYRGAALLMANDLASTPRSGLNVQCCGDAHLSNFGVFASPERQARVRCQRL